MHAAVVELYSLTDPIRAGSEHDHGAVAGWCRLVLVFERGVEVRGAGLELGGARVDRLEGRGDARRPAQRRYLALLGAPQVGQLRVAETRPLRRTQRLF